MKDAKGHGSDPRGAHAEGINQIGRLTPGEQQILASGNTVTPRQSMTSAREEAFFSSLPLYEQHISPNSTWDFMKTPKGIAGVTLQNLHRPDSEPSAVNLHWLTAIDRGAGHAALDMIVSAADKHGVVLTGEVVPLKAQGQGKTLSTGKLEDFYKSFGFKQVGRRSGGYINIERKPKGVK